MLMNYLNYKEINKYPLRAPDRYILIMTIKIFKSCTTQCLRNVITLRVS